MVNNDETGAQVTGRTWWPRAVQTLLRAAIALHHRRDQLPVQLCQAQRQRLEQFGDWLFSRSPVVLARNGALKPRLLWLLSLILPSCMVSLPYKPFNNSSLNLLFLFLFSYPVCSYQESNGFANRVYNLVADEHISYYFVNLQI